MTCANVNIFHFGPFFSFYQPNSPKNLSSEKMKKTPGDITISHVYQILSLDDEQFLRYCVRWTDRRTDRRMEKVTYRGGCPT